MRIPFAAVKYSVSAQYAKWTPVTYVLGIFNFSSLFVSNFTFGVSSVEWFYSPYSAILNK